MYNVDHLNCIYEQRNYLKLHIKYIHGFWFLKLSDYMPMAPFEEMNKLTTFLHSNDLRVSFSCMLTFIDRRL